MVSLAQETIGDVEAHIAGELAGATAMLSYARETAVSMANMPDSLMRLLIRHRAEIDKYVSEHDAAVVEGIRRTGVTSKVKQSVSITGGLPLSFVKKVEDVFTMQHAHELTASLHANLKLMGFGEHAGEPIVSDMEFVKVFEDMAKLGHFNNDDIKIFKDLRSEGALVDNITFTGYKLLEDLPEADWLTELRLKASGSDKALPFNSLGAVLKRHHGEVVEYSTKVRRPGLAVGGAVWGYCWWW